MRVSAKADYAVRATVELAAGGGGPLKRDFLATAQSIPAGFLENILLDLRHADVIRSQRGPDGVYWLARPAEEITVADVVRAVEGPLASVRGERPGALSFQGSARPLEELWARGAGEPAFGARGGDARGSGGGRAAGGGRRTHARPRRVGEALRLG
jgi:Rrf2 family protein